MTDNQAFSIIQAILKVAQGLGATSNVDVVANTAGLATGADIASVVTALADLPNIELNTDQINLNTDGLETLLTAILANNRNKLYRIQGASNYASVITYVGATDRVNTITHTGTTDLGAESILATYGYDGSNRLTTITYS